MSLGRNIRGGRAAVFALSALLCLALVAPGSAFAASISGTVTDAGTHEPVEGLEVCAYPLSEEWETWICEATDASGEYTIASLEPDEYAVEFWGRPLGYVPQFFDGEEHWWESDPVLVETDPVTGIDAEMVVGGRVEGIVSEAGSGNPLEGILVCAESPADENFGGCAETDDAGEYAIDGMPAGEFVIEFWPFGENFVPQFYDHRSSWSEADPLTVALGGVDTGIDADLLPGAEVEGQVRHKGSPVSEAEVCAWSTDPEGAARCTYSEPDGRYAIQGLPSDQYKVEFIDWSSELLQYWDHKGSWEEANPLSLAAGSAATGIDADLGDDAGPVPPPVVTPPPTTPPVTAKPHPKRCKKGFRKKRVHGKARCVKKKRRHHRHHLRGRPAASARSTFRFGR